MRFSKLLAVLFIAAWVPGCGQQSGGAPKINTPNGPTLPVLTGANVIPLTVNGSECSAGSYFNKPCVSVTVCEPGTSNCQTIKDILVDTGSTGLRVFGSLITVNLPQITSGGKPVAQCTQFGDGTSDWGPVKRADIVLGGEPAVTTNIQVIDSTFGDSAAKCSGADVSPASTGFNGILGVSQFTHDCGSPCSTLAGNNIYFTCTATSGATCTSSTLALGSQVQNPVALLPTDKNGVVIALPSVPLGGAASATGYLILGIDTATNNVPSGVSAYPTNPSNGTFVTTFEGRTLTGFLDTGSNGLYFPSSSIPTCTSGFFCPTELLTRSAVNTAATGSPSGTVEFQIGNFQTLKVSGNAVFSELGGNISGPFDFGLSFHLGRNIYVGIEGTSSVSLGTGPYFAF